MLLKQRKKCTKKATLLNVAFSVNGKYSEAVTHPTTRYRKLYSRRQIVSVWLHHNFRYC